MEQIIFHKEGLHTEGPGYLRTAVRAVISDGENILMIHSGLNGDYKFPGGGMEEGETREQALTREVKEECGLEISTDVELLGHITEYDAAKEEKLDYFRMDSFYYRCGITGSGTYELNLDQYEKELQFTPVWVDLESALKNNKSLIESEDNLPRWVIRETMFLEYLLEQEVFR